MINRLLVLVPAAPVAAIALTAGLTAAGPHIHDPLHLMPAAADSAGGFSSAADAQGFRAEAVDERTHAIPLGPNGSLELKNVSGTIECLAGSGPDVSVEVRRRARGRTDADARLGLEEVQVEIDRQGERAVLAASYPQQRRNAPYSVDVGYVVTAPPGTRLTINSVSGDVTVRGIKGDMAVASVSGSVTVTGAARVAVAKSVSGDVTVLDTSTDGGVTAGSVSGDVRLDAVRAARIDAQTVSGSVVARNATARSVVLKTTSGDVDYQGTIAPQGRYEFLSHSGDVRVGAQPGAGFEIQASTFSGTVRTEPGLSTTKAGGTMRSTVGDGSAVVVTTTFSGDILVVTR